MGTGIVPTVVMRWMTVKLDAQTGTSATAPLPSDACHLAASVMDDLTVQMDLMKLTAVHAYHVTGSVTGRRTVHWETTSSSITAVRAVRRSSSSVREITAVWTSLLSVTE